jgi:transcriptional regulator with XRE-family HTH domain
MKMLYVEQIRAARALLGWSQKKLAEKSDVGIATIKRIEVGNGLVVSSTRSAWRLQQTLQNGGVTFIDATTISGPGVLLTEPPSNLNIDSAPV